MVILQLVVAHQTTLQAAHFSQAASTTVYTVPIAWEIHLLAAGRAFHIYPGFHANRYPVQTNIYPLA
jgi:hypothetical protein